jgi:trans-aconitate methyltransferase
MVYFDDDYNVHLYQKLINMPENYNVDLVEQIYQKNIDISNVLSLGCGCGSIDKYIIEKKNTLYCGIDNSQNMLIDLIKTNSDKKFILIKEDLKYFNIDKVKIKFDLVLLLGILPFFNNQHIKSILKKIYDATHPGALVVFNIDTNGFRWFENYPRAHEAYSNIFIKRIFSDFNKKKNNFKIKSRKKFLDQSSLLKIILDANHHYSYFFDGEVNYSWKTQNITLEEIVEIITGQKKVLHLPYYLPSTVRNKLYQKYKKKYSNGFKSVFQFQLGRNFVFLRKK